MCLSNRGRVNKAGNSSNKGLVNYPERGARSVGHDYSGTTNEQVYSVPNIVQGRRGAGLLPIFDKICSGPLFLRGSFQPAQIICSGISEVGGEQPIRIDLDANKDAD